MTARSARVVATVLCTAAAASAAAQEPAAGSTLVDAITGGNAQLAFRYRYEHVSQDTSDDDANASTLRVRLNYETGAWQNWSGLAEFDYIGHLLVRDFNTGAGTSPGRTQYPVVADPKGADLNQLYLDYAASERLQLRLGRQRILLDNQRFVGGVGWRQNEQTYDGISLTYDEADRFSVFYSYVGRVNRIFGERSAAGKNSVHAQLLHGNVSINADWKVVPYVYYIDNDDVPAFSTATAGARLSGHVPAGDSKLAVTAEFATQSDAANAPLSYRASYWHASLGYDVTKAVSVAIGFESLGGNQNNAGEQFRTPLATLHAFQGWADQFLATPDAGVNDTYARLGWQFAAWKLTAIYHDFRAQDGGARWGSELDVSVARKLGDRYGLLLKAALFSADEPPFSDVSKLWLQLTAGF
ncbi:MAG: alginate export family protein [Gammaproteobacteria bacterium]|nr:alginate export family protein [Gammaproteobacteria bacterium]